jgi:RNA polymerase sigma-32 factor
MRQSNEEDEAHEWQTYLVDESPSPEAIVAEQDEKVASKKRWPLQSMY